MIDDSQLRSLLTDATSGTQAPVVLPDMTRRRARLAQIRNVIGTMLGIGIIAAGGFTVSNMSTFSEPQKPAGQEKTVLGTGQTGDLNWSLKLVEEGCFEVVVAGVEDEDDALCMGFSTSSRFDVVPGMTGGLSYVFGIVQEDADVSIHLEGGGSWAGLIYPGEEGTQYFFRPFDQNEIAGVVNITEQDGQQGGARFMTDADVMSFGTVGGDGIGEDNTEGASSSVEYRWNGHYPLPGFEELPGRTYVIHPGGNYDVVLQTTTDELCLHLEGDSACRSRASLSEPLRLHVSHRFGESRLMLVGEVSDNVDSVDLKEGEDDTYYAQIQGGEPEIPGFGRWFVVRATLTGEPVVVVLYDADGAELDRVQIAY